MKEKEIHFYEREFYMFSNFSSFSVEMDGVQWPTSEHLYQAMKFMGQDSDIVAQIKNAPSAHEARQIAKKYPDQVIKDWDTIKVEMMEKIIREKHAQHTYIQKKLLESMGRELIEVSPRDSFWGWGPNKDGENHLGKVWMKVRDETVKKIK